MVAESFYACMEDLRQSAPPTNSKLFFNTFSLLLVFFYVYAFCTVLKGWSFTRNRVFFCGGRMSNLSGVYFCVAIFS